MLSQTGPLGRCFLDGFHIQTSDTMTRKLIVLLPLLLLAGCEKSPLGSGPLDKLPRPLTASEEGVITASNQFAFDLFREVNRSEAGANVFVSPLSASMALGMTMNGARGTTLDAMRGTLGFSQMPLGNINASYKSLIALLLGLDRNVDMRIANSIWYRNDYPFEQAFFDTTRSYFNAEVAGLDFSDPNAPKTINAWVDRSTNGKIKDIVDKLSPNEVMYLINAIYFKGSWTRQFDRARTRDDWFTAADGSRQPVKMMNQEGAHRYFQTAEMEAVELPYGNGAFVMNVMLPAPGKDVDALIASLDTKQWQEWTNRFAEQQMLLQMPRFRIEYEKSFNQALQALGMGIAFGGGHDFTGMSQRNPWIDEVFQKTYVDVNEEGTEAAAVTKVVMAESAPPTMRVDRPFIFAIRERFSGTLIFIGKIAAPPAG
ncbi:serpin family protein [soil metagenome]